MRHDQIEQALEEYARTGESFLSDDAFDLLSTVLGETRTEVVTTGEWPVTRHPLRVEGIDICARSASEWISMASGRLPGVISPKHDGMSLLLTYQNGRLVRGALRGDGTQGEEITENLLRVVPQRIDTDELLHLRIELIISENNLAVLNERRVSNGLKPYTSARSAVTMARARSAKQNDLALLSYVVLPTSEADSLARLEAARSLGFKTCAAFHGTTGDAWRFLEELDKTRESWPALLDGVVFASPEFTAKLKFKPSAAITTVVSVDDDIGRTGVITPVCVFEPVKLAGATINRASLHTVGTALERMSGIGPGAKVIISRRGDVIPHVEAVVTASSQPWEPPRVCPSCGNPVETDGSIAKCSADPSKCPATTVGLLVKFCSALGIDGVGPAVATGLASAGITLPHQLVSVDPNALAMVEVGGSRLGESTARKIRRSIDSHIEVTWGTLLGALGIPGCAASTMETVAATFPAPEELRDAKDTLRSIEGIGSTRGDAIAWFIESKWTTVVEPLLDVVMLVVPGGALKGVAICITGGLRSMSRDEAAARIRALGGAFTTSVNRKTTHVVCDDPSSMTRKAMEARSRGLPILSEDQLLEMLGGTTEETERTPDDDF